MYVHLFFKLSFLCRIY